MDRYDIIGAFRDYAESNNWHFAAGSNWVLNYHNSKFEFSNGQLILACMFTCLPDMVNGVVQSVSYDGVIFLGRKFDNDGKACNLDETFIQKYDNRLKELIELFMVHIGAFSCEHKLNVRFNSMPYELDQFDTDIDLIAANVIFTEK